MADNKVEKPEVQAEKDKKVDEDDREEEEDAKSEALEKVENGDAQENEENGKPEEDTEKAEKEEPENKTCSIKRKSAGGDAPDGTPTESATPEKKQKLEEPTSETEAKGEAEVAA